MRVVKSIVVKPSVISVTVQEEFIKKTKKVDEIEGFFIDCVSVYFLYRAGGTSIKNIEKCGCTEVSQLMGEWLRENTSGSLRFNLDLNVIVEEDGVTKNIFFDGIPLYDMGDQTVFILDKVVTLGNHNAFSKKAYKEVINLLLNYDNDLFPIKKVKVIENALLQ